MLNGFDYVLAALAALAAGAVNAIAGGGTLITFPMLKFLGVPAVTANVTNTVALCPGYFGGTIAQWNDLKTQTRRLWLVIPASIVGGILGGFLLLETGVAALMANQSGPRPTLRWKHRVGFFYRIRAAGRPVRN